MFTSNNKLLCGKPKPIYSYCRLCAKPKTYDEIVDLSTNKEVLDRILRIIQFFKLNFLDLSNSVLPKAVCKLCLRSTYSAYVFFMKVKHSQVLLKRFFKCKLKPQSKHGPLNEFPQLKKDNPIKPKKNSKVEKQSQSKVSLSHEFVDTQKNNQAGICDEDQNPTEHTSIKNISLDKRQPHIIINNDAKKHSIQCDNILKTDYLQEFLQIKNKNEEVQPQKCSQNISKKRKHPTASSKVLIEMKEIVPLNKKETVNLEIGKCNLKEAKKKPQQKQKHITEELSNPENLLKGIDETFSSKDPKRRKLEQKPIEELNANQSNGETTQNDTEIFNMGPIFYISLENTSFNTEIPTTDPDFITNDYQTTLIEKDLSLHELQNGETLQKPINELDNIIDLQDLQNTDSFMNLNEREIVDNTAKFQDTDNLSDILDFQGINDLTNVGIGNTEHNIETGSVVETDLKQVREINLVNVQKIENMKNIVNDQVIENFHDVNLPGIDTNFTSTQDIETVNLSNLQDLENSNLHEINKRFSDYSGNFIDLNDIVGINDIQDNGVNFQDINCAISVRDLQLSNKQNLENAISLQEIENVGIINVQGIESVNNVINLEDCCISGEAISLQDTKSVQDIKKQNDIIKVNNQQGEKTLNRNINLKNIEHGFSDQMSKLQDINHLQETDTDTIFNELQICDGVMNIQTEVGEASINDFYLQSIETGNDVLNIQEVENIVNLEQLNNNILKSKEVARTQNFMNMQTENNIMQNVANIIDLQELNNEENIVTLNETDYSWSSYRWQCLHCKLELADMDSLREHSKEAHRICSGFSCIDCSEQLYTYNAFIEHVRQHRNMLRYYCQFCNERFDTLELCSSHILTHWQRSQEICERCGEIFTDQDEMKRHKRQYKKIPLPKSYYNTKPALIVTHDEKSWNDYEWACQECYLRLPDSSALRQHAQDYHNKCFAMKCMDCLRTMNNFRWFITHVTTHRPYLKHYCPYCNTYFLDLKRLHKHEDDHLNGPQKPCQGCGQVFLDNRQMSLHMKRFNSPRLAKDLTTEDLTCDVCDKVCRNILGFRKHKKIHGQMTKYICNICGKQYNRSNSLSAHLRTHKGKTEICKLCNKGFCTKYKLRAHVKTHKEDRLYVCDDCGNAYKTKSTLKSHVLKHIKKSSYKCPICPKQFRFKDNMKVHVNIHTDTKPFSCKVCKRTFSNFSNCHKHMMRMHGVPYAKTKRTERGAMEINRKTGTIKEIVQNETNQAWLREIIQPEKAVKKKTDKLAKLLTDILN